MQSTSYIQKSYEEAVKRIRRYLKNTKYKGLVFMPNGSNGLEYITPMHIFLEHGVENMQIKFDQCFQELDTLSNSQSFQSFG